MDSRAASPSDVVYQPLDLPKRQRTFGHRLRNVKSRNSSPRPERVSRQSTLSQFVDRPSSNAELVMISSDDDWDYTESRPKKRRKRDGGERTKRRQNTLTQMAQHGFPSSGRVRIHDEVDEEGFQIWNDEAPDIPREELRQIQRTRASEDLQQNHKTLNYENQKAKDDVLTYSPEIPNTSSQWLLEQTAVDAESSHEILPNPVAFQTPRKIRFADGAVIPSSQSPSSTGVSTQHSCGLQWPSDVERSPLREKSGNVRGFLPRRTCTDSGYQSLQSLRKGFILRGKIVEHDSSSTHALNSPHTGLQKEESELGGDSTPTLKPIMTVQDSQADGSGVALHSHPSKLTARSCKERLMLLQQSEPDASRMSVERVQSVKSDENRSIIPALMGTVKLRSERQEKDRICAPDPSVWRDKSPKSAHDTRAKDIDSAKRMEKLRPEEYGSITRPTTRDSAAPVSQPSITRTLQRVHTQTRMVPLNDERLLSSKPESSTSILVSPPFRQCDTGKEHETTVRPIRALNRVNTIQDSETEEDSDLDLDKPDGAQDQDEAISERIDRDFEYNDNEPSTFDPAYSALARDASRFAWTQGRTQARTQSQYSAIPVSTICEGVKDVSEENNLDAISCSGDPRKSIADVAEAMNNARSSTETKFLAQPQDKTASEAISADLAAILSSQRRVYFYPQTTNGDGVPPSECISDLPKSDAPLATEHDKKINDCSTSYPSYARGNEVKVPSSPPVSSSTHTGTVAVNPGLEVLDFDRENEPCSSLRKLEPSFHQALQHVEQPEQVEDRVPSSQSEPPKTILVNAPAATAARPPEQAIATDSRNRDPTIAISSSPSPAERPSQISTVVSTQSSPSRTLPGGQRQQYIPESPPKIFTQWTEIAPSSPVPSRPPWSSSPQFIRPVGAQSPAHVRADEGSAPVDLELALLSAEFSFPPPPPESQWPGTTLRQRSSSPVVMPF